MSLSSWKTQNENYKTLNLDGILFLINDSNDELGQHFTESIESTNFSLAFELTDRKRRLSSPFYFFCIPDKSVLLQDYIIKYLDNATCRRPFLDKIKHLDHVVDTYKDILAINEKHGYNPCIPNDTHVTMLSLYGIYKSIVQKLGLQPYDYEIVRDEYEYEGDLSWELNNGDRKVDLKSWPLPFVRQKCSGNENEEPLDRWFRNIVSGERIEVENENKRELQECVHIYVNPNSNSEKRVLIFHDSFLNIPYGTSFAKEWIARHFRETYFVWSPFCQEIVALYPADLIIEISAERFIGQYRSRDFFDNEYYLSKYPGVKTLIENGTFKSAKEYYKEYGFGKGHICNQYLASEMVFENDVNLEIEMYEEKYPIVARFKNEFPKLALKDFYNIYGRKMGHLQTHKTQNFDIDFYIQKYSNILDYPRTHYSMCCRGYALSPNACFDEAFYKSFYNDVQKAIINGKFNSGFDHYLKFGRVEGRLCQYDPRACLNKRQPEMKDLEYRQRVPLFQVDLRLGRRIWFLIDSFNPDLFSRGFEVILKFMEHLLRFNYNIGFYVACDKFDARDYFKYHYPKSILSSLLYTVEFFHKADNKTFSYGPHDIFIALSSWTLNEAYIFSKIINKNCIYFIQEYEAIFHPNDAYRFIINSNLLLPHVSIFNSVNLQTYFQKHNLGVFSSTGKYYTLDHVPLVIEKPTQHQNKRLILYGRRDLFEIAIMAIRGAISRGYFLDWDIVAFGCPTKESNILLTALKSIKCYCKIETLEYCQLLASSDVALCLRSGPDPGLVPDEMVEAGLITVVNTFETRPVEYYNYNPRFIVVANTIEDIILGLVKAEEKSSDWDLRTALVERKRKSWDEIYSEVMIDSIFNLL